jgi:hypothetical protein
VVFAAQIAGRGRSDRRRIVTTIRRDPGNRRLSLHTKAEDIRSYVMVCKTTRTRGDLCQEVVRRKSQQPTKRAIAVGIGNCSSSWAVLFAFDQIADVWITEDQLGKCA